MCRSRGLIWRWSVAVASWICIHTPTISLYLESYQIRLGTMCLAPMTTSYSWHVVSVTWRSPIVSVVRLIRSWLKGCRIDVCGFLATLCFVLQSVAWCGVARPLSRGTCHFDSKRLYIAVRRSARNHMRCKEECAESYEIIKLIRLVRFHRNWSEEVCMVMAVRPATLTTQTIHTSRWKKGGSHYTGESPSRLFLGPFHTWVCSMDSIRRTR